MSHLAVNASGTFGQTRATRDRHANPAPVMSWYDYGYADQLDSGKTSL